MRKRWLRGWGGFVESGGVVRNAQVAQEWTRLEELLSLISQDSRLADMTTRLRDISVRWTNPISQSRQWNASHAEFLQHRSGMFFMCYKGFIVVVFESMFDRRFTAVHFMDDCPLGPSDILQCQTLFDLNICQVLETRWQCVFVHNVGRGTPSKLWCTDILLWNSTKWPICHVPICTSQLQFVRLKAMHIIPRSHNDHIYFIFLSW